MGVEPRKPKRNKKHDSGTSVDQFSSGRTVKKLAVPKPDGKRRFGKQSGVGRAVSDFENPTFDAEDSSPSRDSVAGTIDSAREAFEDDNAGNGNGSPRSRTCCVLQ